MQKKILYFIFIILLVFVIVLLLVLLKDANKGLDNTNNRMGGTKKDDYNLVKQNSWLKKLSGYEQKDYIMPVTELFITIKYRDKTEKKSTKKEKYYRLVVPNLDNYSLFCILRIFEDQNVSFVIQKNLCGSKIYLNTKERVRLSNISKKLKQYDIKSYIKSCNKYNFK